MNTPSYTSIVRNYTSIFRIKTQPRRTRITQMPHLTSKIGHLLDKPTSITFATYTSIIFILRQPEPRIF